MKYKLLIRKYRLLRGMTQAELAYKSNIRQSYISDLENSSNIKSPTLRTILKIADALNVCPHVLVQYDTSCDNNCLKHCKRNLFWL